MTDLNLADNGLTIRDDKLNCLVFERQDNGLITSWSKDVTGAETRSVPLSVDDRLRIIAFLSRGLA